MPNNQRIGFNCPASSGDPISVYLNRTISGSNSVSIRYWDAENDDEPVEEVLSITAGDNEGTEFSNQSPVCAGRDLEINAAYDPADYEFYRKTEGVSWIELYYYDANDGGKKKKREIPAGRKRPTK